LGEKKLNSIADLFRLIDTLRGENGCPWDRRQTPASMAIYLAEETFELIEAIESGDTAAIREELGDVLFLLLFILRMYSDQDHFDLSQVTQQVTTKMVRRHPHVFSDNQVDTPGQVKRQWQEIKQAEKDPKRRESIMDAVPSGLPALLRAYRVSERAAQAGFDWEALSGVLEKVGEEWAEFNRELSRSKPTNNASANLAMEFGDLVFTLANVARFAGFHPETALTGAVNKFVKRFKAMESQLSAKGLEVGALAPAELDTYWEAAKKQTK